MALNDHFDWYPAPTQSQTPRQFRKKPVTITAEQFRSTNKPWPAGIYFDGNRYLIDTLEGPLNVSEGDWIITGVRGERYPCKPDIFEETYEEV